MPVSGEKNTLFGVYCNDCCALEIVISVGAEFPACPKHPAVRTSWIQIEISPDEVIILPPKSKAEPAA